MRWIGRKVPRLKCWYTKKTCYDHKSAVTAINLRWKQDHVKLRAYWCDKCNFSHLTKNINYNKFMSEETTSPDVELEPTSVPTAMDLPAEEIIPEENA